MDATTDLKNSLISRIKNSKDINFLKALQTLFDASEKSLYQLSEEQLHSINEGREEIKRGEYVDNEEVISNTRKWLKNK
jgi:predicted transcriptional regulator